ncbi:MAG: DNA-processing protein DprA [Candidatus Daviesbacteria bacterium]|nr:DNA-processing protein DprA [Candidatus Daviesbacteria bacterium]
MQYHKLKNWQSIPELKSLHDLSTPPKELYFAGKWNPDIIKNCSAVVGSRKMTDYGARVVEKIIPSLIMQGKTVISGFMYGVDQHVHEVCVENRGKTIAVLGWGIDTPLFGSDLALAKKIIASGGILLSEWKTLKAAHWTFPARNRIVAALSSEVFIVEAAQKSGSLITAAIAAKLKRKLWAVPGPVTSRTSKGTNQLIASGKAQMWLGTDHLPGEYETDDPILEILQNEALTADEIARKLKNPVSETGANLSLLLLSGQILEKGGKYYIADVN